MGWNPMGEQARWGFDGREGVYYVQCWPTAAAGDGEHAIDGCGASSPEEDRREGGRGLHWGKGALVDEAPTAPG